MTPNALLLIAAVLLQGAIALVLLWVMGTIRVPLVRTGKVRIADVALSRQPWPESEKRVSNSFDNQFQLPVLFYVAVGVALFFAPTLFEVVLGWLFVLSRIAHAAIFATANNVMHRFSAFTMGYFILVVFWIDLVVRLILAAAHGGA